MWWTNTNVKGQRVKFRFLSLPLLLLSFQFLMAIRMFPVLCMCLLLLRLGETYFFRDVHVRINSMLSELSSFGMSLSNMLDAPSFSQVALQCHHRWKRTHCLPAKWIKSLMKIPSGKCSKSEWLMNWVFLSTRNQWSRSQRCIFTCEHVPFSSCQATFFFSVFLPLFSLFSLWGVTGAASSLPDSSSFTYICTKLCHRVHQTWKRSLNA